MDKKIIVPMGKLGQGVKEDKPPVITYDFSEDHFYKELEGFRDTDHVSVWDKVELNNHLYHVRIFVYQSEGKKNSSFLTLDAQGVAIPLSESIEGREFTHIAKVIQVGTLIENPAYSVGDLILLDKYEVTGHSFSPEYLQIEQYANAYNMKPKVPEGVTKTVEAVQGHWKNFAMVLPHEYKKPAHEIFNYAIGAGKIKAKYTL